MYAIRSYYGEEGWLIDLSDGGEIVQAPTLAGVPLVRPWFSGIANVRGNLVITSYSIHYTKLYDC